MSRAAAIAALDRIDPSLGSFIEVDPDGVLAEARTAPSGPLSGVTVAVKDLIDTAGLRTTYGSALYADHVPTTSAAVVEALRHAGAVVVGKTNLNEFAYGANGFNPHFGPALNPKDRSRTAGGSSGGSAAAVAAGVCPLAVGTDTNGSVRVPAACCGVYGLKLSHNPADSRGVFPLAKSLDSLGFFATRVEMLARVLGIEELPRPDQLDVRRIGVDIELPPLPASHWAVFEHQVRTVHAQRHQDAPEKLGLELRRLLGMPQAGDLQSAQAEMAAWRARFLEITAGADVLVGPVLDGAAPRLKAVLADYTSGESRIRSRMLRHTPVYNALGWPALAVPTTDGSVQVAGRPGNEAAILAVGQSLGLPSGETITP